MSENIKPRFKLGIKGSTIFLVVCVAILIFILFGGKGTNTTDLYGYAAGYDVDHPGSVNIFDIGTSSKVAIIRHEDGSLSGLAFRKIPLIDRWKLTQEDIPLGDSQDKSVWITVDDGFKEYIIISDGERLTAQEDQGWYGIYASMLYDLAFGLVVIGMVNVSKRLWKRHGQKKEIPSIPE